MLAAGEGAEEYMRQVRIELTTLGLWDLRAASCATAAPDQKGQPCKKCSPNYRWQLCGRREIPDLMVSFAGAH